MSKRKTYYVFVIYGIGIDIVHIDRMRTVTEKWGEKFLRRVFSGQEISYCSRKINPYPSFAVRFAAKEAFIKAIGAEIPVSFTDIEVVLSATGKPSFNFSEKIIRYFTVKRITSAHLSLSHDREYGVASVVLEV
jgi:holo-[acyl-carrier protein] synthase